MSYQAITDIIANQSQVQDFQLSAAIKDSPKQSSISFEDLLASYKEDDKVEEAKPLEAEKIENKENASEVKVEKKKEPEEKSENAVRKNEIADSDKKTDAKADDKLKIGEKSDKKINISDKKELSKNEKKNVKDVKDSKKDKKLSEKDFLRLENLEKNAEEEGQNEKIKFAALSQKLSEKAEEQPVNKEKDESVSAIERDLVIQPAVIENAGEAKPENSTFDFSGKNENTKKQFALDKEGKITVEDQRTKLENEVSSEENKKPLVKTSEIKLTNDSTAVMSLDLNPNAEADVLSLNTQTAASNGSNYQAMLSNQLSNVAPEFVKAGNIVLKDNNQGTINLILHPDDLGNVKIHLSLDGKTLSGHITVATKEALQVFKDNAETLREAFIKSGFDTASFDVAMNNGGSFNQNMGFEGQDETRNLFAKRAYGDSAEGLSAEFDDIFENIEDMSNYSVNIVA